MLDAFEIFDASAFSIHKYCDTPIVSFDSIPQRDNPNMAIHPLITNMFKMTRLSRFIIS